MACNMLAVSGAFLVGLTSLHVVVLTNLGALAAGAFYDRHFRRSSAMLLSNSKSVASTEAIPVQVDSPASASPRMSTRSDNRLSHRQTDFQGKKS
jgi:hypothetical protein